MSGVPEEWAPGEGVPGPCGVGYLGSGHQGRGNRGTCTKAGVPVEGTGKRMLGEGGPEEWVPNAGAYPGFSKGGGEEPGKAPVSRQMPQVANSERSEQQRGPGAQPLEHFVLNYALNQ